MMMARTVLRVVLWFAALATAVADADHPLRIRPVNVVRGRVIELGMAGTDKFVVTPRAAWESNRPAIERRNAAGNVVATALPQCDIVDAVASAHGIVVAIRRPYGVELQVLDAQLRTTTLGVIERQTSVRRCRIGTLPTDSRSVVLVDDDVYVSTGLADSLVFTLLQSQSHGFVVLPKTHSMALAVVHASGSVGYVTFFDRSLRARMSPTLPLADAAYVDTRDSLVVVRSPLEGGLGTHVFVIGSDIGQPRYLTVATTPELVAVAGTARGCDIGSVVVTNGRYTLRVVRVLPRQSVIFDAPLPADYGRPKALQSANGRWYVVADAGLVAITEAGSIEASDTVAAGMLEGLTFSSDGQDTIVATGRNTTVTLVVESQPFWWFYVFVNEALAYVIPGVLVLLVFVIRRHARHLATMLDAMLELPGAGMVFHLDANARLIRANDAGSRLLRLSKSVPMRRLFRSYATHKDAAALLDFVQKSHSLRLVVTENVVVGSATGPREYLFTSIPIRGTLGRFVGMLITGVDITEELERRRLVNWAQLAHDMQTNLSTIRLNAEQLQGASPSDVERRRRILFQVGVLIQRVRDLVSVGRSDTLDRIPVHSAELCTDIRHEFDSAVFPHVTFQMKLRGTIMHVDRLKVSRAVRNAVENGIKALRNQPGTIEIATWFDRSNVYIRVSDSGIGMDSETLANMMKPHFTTAQDGSGTGIGTMIMQHVVTLHGGSLRVMSAPGKGTQVVFRIPLGTTVETSATEFTQSLS